MSPVSPYFSSISSISYWSNSELTSKHLEKYCQHQINSPSTTILFIWKTRRDEIRIPDQGWILIHVITENRLRHACVPVHFHRIRYINSRFSILWSLRLFVPNEEGETSSGCGILFDTLDIDSGSDKRHSFILLNI